MASELRFTPDYASPPGETIEDMLEARGMTPADLAEQMGISAAAMDALIGGEASITEKNALLLERVLKTPARFWLVREGMYREACASASSAERRKP